MIREWADRTHRDRLLFGCGRAPSLAMIHRIALLVDPVGLDTAVAAWTTARTRTSDTPLPAIAIDGKEVRGSKHANGDRVFLMAALDQADGTVLAQEAIGVKTNEIPHLPLLLDRLGSLDGKVVTIDALHTLGVQAKAIIARGGHYVFTVKANQHALRERRASQGWSRRTPGYQAREKAHGRTSTREAAVQPAQAWIGFPHAAQTMRIIRGRNEHGTENKTGELAYVITSLPPKLAGATELAELIRGHWGIENRLHWVRDTAYREDASQVRTGHAAHVMASLRALDHEPETVRQLTGLRNRPANRGTPPVRGATTARTATHRMEPKRASRTFPYGCDSAPLGPIPRRGK